MRDNIGKVEVDDELNATVDLLSLSLSAGELGMPRIGAEVGERQVVFRWERQPLMPRLAKDDRLFGAVFERVLQRSRLVELGMRGESGELAWTLPEDWNPGSWSFTVSPLARTGKRRRER